MNLPYFIAQRLIKGRREGTSFSQPIKVIAIIGIAIGLAVMILAVAILTGFKQQIREKIVGFGSNIQIVNFDSNLSYETAPIHQGQEFIEKIKGLPGISHVQVFATKAGIIKTDEDFQGVVLKGVGSDFDWSYFSSNMTDGSVFTVSDTARTDKVIISKKISDLNFQGVVLKGVGSDFDWSYFSSNMTDGSVFTVSDTARTDKVIISKKISDML